MFLELLISSFTITNHNWLYNERLLVCRSNIKAALLSVLRRNLKLKNMQVQEQPLKIFNHYSHDIVGEYYYSTIHELDSHFIEVFAKAATLPEKGTLTVKVEVNFLVSRAKQSMASFMHQIAEHNLNYLDHAILIEWRYEFDDEDIQELGEIFQDVFKRKGLGDRFRLVSLL